MYPHLSDALPQLATIEEVAPLLQMHPDTVTRKCRSGEIPATRIGRRWLINVGQLAELLNATSR